MSSWVKIKKKEARYHPLYGNGGFSAFYLFQLVMGCIVTFAISPPWAVPLDETASNFVIVAIFAAFLYLSGKHNIWFVRLSIIFHLLMAPVYALTALWLGLGSGELDGETAGGMSIALGWSIFWLGYFVLSRRINVTYRLRVKEEEIPMVWGQKKIDRVYGPDYFQYE